MPEPSTKPKSRRFFSAATLERAVMEAAGHYGLGPAELAYKPVEKRHGFTKSRKVVIRVDPEHPRAAASEPPSEPSRDSQAAQASQAPASAGDGRLETQAPEPPQASAPAEAAPSTASQEVDSPEDGDDREPAVSASRARAPAAQPPASQPAAPRKAATREAVDLGSEMSSLPKTFEDLRRTSRRAGPEVTAAAREQLVLLLDLAGLELEANVFEGEDGYEIELSGADSDLAIEDEGQVMRAIEHLLPRLMQAQLGEVILCRVDCQGFQVLREESLRTKAQRAAASVRSRDQSETLEPMHPADRRIVHVALVADASVTTESVGRGYFRRVSIRPA